jgi:isochorismate pyruvate lyase
MTNEIRSAEDCTTMAEVRAGIDRLDGQIMALLGKRFRYVEAAARIKRDLQSIRDESRISEVIENVRRAAENDGVPPDVAADLYRLLIEASVTHEFEKFGQKAPSA